MGVSETKQLNMDQSAAEPVTEQIMLPMRDGVLLETWVIRPAGELQKPLPTILQRTPYAHTREFGLKNGRYLAKQGFAFVMQFCRGTSGSGGEWVPNVNEREDGLCTLEWLSAQPFVDQIGYWGDSYLALTGWCMADAVPEKVAGMYLGVYGTDRFTSAYEKGLFRHDVLTAWAMENAGYPVTADYLESCKYRPHIEVDEVLWGKKVPWYRDWITAVRESDAYWQEGFWKMLRDIPSKVRIPILIREGWYDHHLGSALKSYENLNPEIKGACTLEIGCWNHGSRNCLEWADPKNLRNDEMESVLEWFRTLLVEKRRPKGEVRVYTIGADEWRKYDSWPVKVGERQRFYFDGRKPRAGRYAGCLTAEAKKCCGEVRYLYNPDNPVPSHGAESMLRSMHEVGSLYQPEAGYREDVCSFLSEPWEKATVIAGKIIVHLAVSSDCEDTAFTAKVMEVKEDGKAVNIRSSITTIDADWNGEPYEPGTVTRVTIRMWDINWMMQKGSRLRVDISSSDFPQYAVHGNQKGIWSLQKEIRKANQTVFCNGDSYVELPMRGK